MSSTMCSLKEYNGHAAGARIPTSASHVMTTRAVHWPALAGFLAHNIKPRVHSEKECSLRRFLALHSAISGRVTTHLQHPKQMFWQLYQEPVSVITSALMGWHSDTIRLDMCLLRHKLFLESNTTQIKHQWWNRTKYLGNERVVVGARSVKHGGIISCMTVTNYCNQSYF